jgi:hypothetical protein
MLPLSISNSDRFFIYIYIYIYIYIDTHSAYESKKTKNIYIEISTNGCRKRKVFKRVTSTDI